MDIGRYARGDIVTGKIGHQGTFVPGVNETILDVNMNMDPMTA